MKTRPVEVEVGAQHRKQHPLAGRPQRVEQQSRARLPADRDVGGDGGGSAYDVPGQHVLGDRLRGGHRFGERTLPSGGQDLVPQRALRGLDRGLGWC